MPMNKDDIKTLLNTIDAFYPNKMKVEDPKFTLAVWHDALKDQDSEQVFFMLRTYAQDHDWPPGISNLLPPQEKYTVPGVNETAERFKRYEEQQAAARQNQIENAEAIEAAKAKIRKILEIEGETDAENN